MRLYNTLTRREEDFAPLRDGTVRMYTCGLTVYARGHVGNFRTFVCLDVLRRVLKYQQGWKVRQVMNFTDVDDRTILESQKAGVPLREYTDRWIEAFREDATALGLEPVEETPRATDAENIEAMGRVIGALEERGHTYRSDGSIYFKISTFPDTGSSRGSITKASRRARESTPTSTTRRTPATSSCGRRRGRASRPGARTRLAPAVPAGTSSAPRWRCGFSASRRSTSTRAGWT